MRSWARSTGILLVASAAVVLASPAIGAEQSPEQPRRAARELLDRAPPDLASNDAAIETARIDPLGRRSGWILQGGIVLPATTGDGFAAGDRVALDLDDDGRLRVRSEATGATVEIGPIGPSMPTGIGGGPNRGARDAVAGLSALKPLTFEGPIRYVLRSLDGHAVGLLLEGGAQVAVLPSVAAVLDALGPTDSVRVHGLGTAGSPSAAWAVVLERGTGPTRQVLLDHRRGRGTPALGLAPAEADAPHEPAAEDPAAASVRRWRAANRPPRGTPSPSTASSSR
jgi:hypothetical protein